MRKIVIICIAVLWVLVGHSQNFCLDPDLTNLNWTGKAAFNTYSLSGTLKAKQGSLMIQGDSIQRAEILVDMLSLDAENQDLKSHLMSKDFFEVSKFPLARFVLSLPFGIDEIQQVVVGDLTIKDETQAQTIPVEIEYQDDKMVIIGQMKIDRTQFGVVYNSPNFFKNLKNQAIADEFDLDYVLVFRVE